MSAYDDSEYHTLSCDKNGSRATLRVNMPPGVRAVADDLIAGRRFPELRNIGDWVRDALYRYNQFLIESGANELSQPQSQWGLEIEAEKRQALRQSLENAVSKWRTEWISARTDKAKQEIRQTVEQYLPTVEEPYRSELRSIIGQ